MGASQEVTIVAHDIGPVGGMERVLTELLRGLRALGHDVTVVARSCELPAGVQVRFRRVPGPSRPFVLAYPWFALLASLMVRRQSSGIVQTTGAIVARRVDVIAIHYCHAVGPAHPSRAGLLFGVHAKLVRRMKKLGERACFRLNREATFVCVSEGVADEVRSHYPAVAANVVTIQNGVDTERFAPGRTAARARELRASVGVGEQALVAAFVGSEWERKGLEPLLEAIAQADGWELLVAGEGDRTRYERTARALGVDDRVRWLGVVSEIEAVYELADAFVSPTAYETFSLVTFEAAASGVPILSTAVSGVRELLRDGENGYLITRDAGLIARRLQELAADEALRARLGAAARATALGFSWTEMARRHHELYERLRP
jgi:UDP-glucose:(heptosyl)LPS alpha-1,3-glucosyltransferase